MAGNGWDATGLLKPLWEQLDGLRDELADLSGIRGTELSSYNSGKKRLGRANAVRIVRAFAERGIEVSVLELGAPVGEADERGLTLLDRLQALEERQSEDLVKLREDLAQAIRRILVLEQRSGGGAGSAEGSAR